MHTRRLRSIVLVAASMLVAGGTARAQAVIAVDDLSLQEPAGGTNVAVFTLRLVDTTKTVFLTVSTAAPAAGVAATAGNNSCGGNVDYLSLNSVGVTLTPTQRSQTVSVTTCGDNLDENDESFRLRIFQSNGQPIQDNEAVATLVDEDPSPSLRVSSTGGTEGAPGATTLAAVTITLSAVSGRDVTVNWATAAAASGLPATAGACGAAGVDFVGAAATPAVIPAGQANVVRNVTICGDDLYEGAERFNVTLSNPVNATIQTSTTPVTITDDEPVPQLALSPTATIGELMPPSVMTKEARFTVNLAGPPLQRPLSFTYTTENGTATSGTACLDVNLNGVISRAGDYVAKSGTEQFDPGGVAAKVIKVGICKLKISAGETFRLRIASSVAQVTAATATATMP